MELALSPIVVVKRIPIVFSLQKMQKTVGDYVFYIKFLIRSIGMKKEPS
jgi:hypothetical protein